MNDRKVLYCCEKHHKVRKVVVNILRILLGRREYSVLKQMISHVAQAELFWWIDEVKQQGVVFGAQTVLGLWPAELARTLLAVFYRALTPFGGVTGKVVAVGHLRMCRLRRH